MITDKTSDTTQWTSGGHRRHVKCVVWDLDNTLWSGTLMESGRVTIRPDTVATLKILDERGILHSIASRNDTERALATLEAFRIRDYFLVPQIGWHSKVPSLLTIAKRLDIGLDTLAFVDDEPVERAEVSFSIPDVRCFSATVLGTLPLLPDFIPPVVSDDAPRRRQMYLCNLRRQAEEERFNGPLDAFLATLEMHVEIARASVEDLSRVEELTLRTNQLNSTGYIYSSTDLEQLCRSAHHLLLVASLKDRFGPYGKVGLALVDIRRDIWTIKLFLTSCRVMSRGVGTILMGYVLREAYARGSRVHAEFIDTGRNRLMYVAFGTAGFREVEQRGAATLLEHDPSCLVPLPDYVRIRTP